VYDVVMLQCVQDVLKKIEDCEQLTRNKCEQRQPVELDKSLVQAAVSSVQNCTAVDPRYVQLCGDKAAVCWNIIYSTLHVLAVYLTCAGKLPYLISASLNWLLFS